jgi:hypothetical protein
MIFAPLCIMEDDLDEEIIQLKMAKPWISNTGIADELEVNRSTVYRHMLKPEVHERIKEIQAGMKAETEVLAKTSIARIQSMVEDPDPRVAAVGIKLALELPGLFNAL